MIKDLDNDNDNVAFVSALFVTCEIKNIIVEDEILGNIRNFFCANFPPFMIETLFQG